MMNDITDSSDDYRGSGGANGRIPVGGSVQRILKAGEEVDWLTQPPGSCHGLVESVHGYCLGQHGRPSLPAQALTRLCQDGLRLTPEVGVEAWRHAAKRAVRPKRVVFLPPVFNQRPRLSQRAKEMLIQAFIPQPADEALHKGILRRLARCDVMPVDPGLLRPLENGMIGQFGTVVGNDHGRSATRRGQLVQGTVKP